MGTSSIERLQTRHAESKKAFRLFTSFPVLFPCLRWRHVFQMCVVVCFVARIFETLLRFLSAVVAKSSGPWLWRAMNLYWLNLDIKRSAASLVMNQNRLSITHCFKPHTAMLPNNSKDKILRFKCFLIKKHPLSPEWLNAASIDCCYCIHAHLKGN